MKERGNRESERAEQEKGKAIGNSLGDYKKKAKGMKVKLNDGGWERKKKRERMGGEGQCDGQIQRYPQVN